MWVIRTRSKVRKVEMCRIVELETTRKGFGDVVQETKACVGAQ